MIRALTRIRAIGAGALVAVTLALLASATPAFGQEPQSWWRLQSRPAPTHLPPGGDALIILTATNMGDKPTSGPITITDTLPAGLNVTYVHGNNWFAGQGTEEGK